MRRTMITFCTNSNCAITSVQGIPITPPNTNYALSIPIQTLNPSPLQTLCIHSTPTAPVPVAATCIINIAINIIIIVAITTITITITITITVTSSQFHSYSRFLWRCAQSLDAAVPPPPSPSFPIDGCKWDLLWPYDQLPPEMHVKHP